MSPKYNPKDQFVFVEIARSIAKSTCQLYTYKEDSLGIPQSHGCCILFEFNDKYYCFSNAHVLGDEYVDNAFVLTNKNNVPGSGKTKTTTLGGQHYCTKLPDSGKREDDSFDMSLINLTLDTVHDLKQRGYLFVSIESIKTGYSSEQDDGLLSVGYPSAKTKVNTLYKKVVAKPFYLLTTPFTKEIKNSKFDKNFHTLAYYRRKKIFDPETQRTNSGPLPYGISGSGLWYLEKDGNDIYKPYLVGILSEYDKQNGILISTKIDLFIDLIKKTTDPSILNNGVGINILSPISINKTL